MLDGAVVDAPGVAERAGIERGLQLVFRQDRQRIEQRDPGPNTDGNLIVTVCASSAFTSSGRPLTERVGAIPLFTCGSYSAANVKSTSTR